MITITVFSFLFFFRGGTEYDCDYSFSFQLFFKYLFPNRTGVSFILLSLFYNLYFSGD